MSSKFYKQFRQSMLAHMVAMIHLANERGYYETTSTEPVSDGYGIHERVPLLSDFSDLRTHVLYGACERVFDEKAPSFLSDMPHMPGTVVEDALRHMACLAMLKLSLNPVV